MACFGREKVIGGQPRVGGHLPLEGGINPNPSRGLRRTHPGHSGTFPRSWKQAEAMSKPKPKKVMGSPGHLFGPQIRTPGVAYYLGTSSFVE